jgi:DNA topoisomerase-2
MATAASTLLIDDDVSFNVPRGVPINTGGVPIRTGQPKKGLIFEEHSEENRYVRTERTLDDYKGLSQQQQIYQIPDMYIGSTSPFERSEWLLDVTNKKLIYTTISTAEGCIRLFLEILSNCGDNAMASRLMGIPLGTIDVTVDRQWVTVRNYGEPIPVAPHPGFQGKLVPDVIFGQLLTSTNYDTKVIRMGCGRNGLGAKLANIFSYKFIVKVGDAKRKQLYEGTWEHNMTEHTAKCTPGYTQQVDPNTGYAMIDPQTGQPQWFVSPGPVYEGPSFVEVSYNMDFQRFGMSEYPDEVIALYARYLIDFSFTCKIPVTFNGISLDYRNGVDYAALLVNNEECKNMIIHYEWAGGIIPEDLKDLTPKELHKAVIRADKPSHVPIIELFAVDTPDKGQTLSYVNGLLTIDGGVHADECQRALSSGILHEINESIKKSNKRNKKDDDGKLPTLNIADVRPHITVIVNARLPDPKYNSQSKTKLMAPKPKIKIDSKSLSMVGKWSLTDRLYAQLDAKMFKTMTKSDGKMRRHLRVDDGEDAEEAGGPESHKCIFYLIEGKSAQALPRKRISWSPGGKKYGGYFPGRGKFINTLTASTMQLAKNTEIAKIKEFLGLMEAMDYSKPENQGKLRYGLTLLAADADADGKHIICLWILLFFTRWPSLIQTGRIGILMQYMAKAIKQRGRNREIVARFLNKQELDKWLSENPNYKSKGIKIKYYKGLGSMKDEDIKEDMDTSPMVVILYDDESPEAMNMVFHSKFADKRKEWIAKWREVSGVSDIGFVPISSFDPRVTGRTLSDIINKDLIEYTLTALKRAIPSFYDGHKDVQRKAEYYCLKQWNYGHSNKDSVKVGRLSNFAAGEMGYHHGEKSMGDAMINKAKDYHGTNNLPFFTQDGQFGTRVDNEDAADGRYSETRPNYWVQYAYDKELTDLIPLNETDGDEVEPQWIPCIIPMHIINGFWGIATGHSTFGPNHNPYHVIDALLQKCQGGEFPELKPWYLGHKGDIKIAKPVAAVPKIIGKTGNGADIVLNIDEDDIDDETIPDEAPLHRDPALQLDSDDDEVGPAGDTELFEATRTKIKGTSMRTFGKFSLIGNTAGGMVVNISELPIGRWILPYKKWLYQLWDEGKVTDVKDGCDHEKVNFTIYGFNHKKGINYNTLKLQRSYGLGNMTLIDHNGYPYKFRNSVHYMDVYYQAMISLFRKLIDMWVAKAKEKIVSMNEKARLIQLIVDRVFVYLNEGDKKIYDQLDEHKIDYSYWEKLRTAEMTQSKINSLRVEIVEQEAELIRLSSITPESEWIRRLLALRAFLQSEKYPYPHP